VRYRVVGEDDYMCEIRVRPDGRYRMEVGTYTSHPPREGVLTDIQAAELNHALDDLGAPHDHPAPEDAAGFVAELTVGEGRDAAVYRFWEGALADEPELKSVVRFLETL
jgi:hypothetical protein